MRWVWIALLGFLTACASAGEIRDPSAPFSSIAMFDERHFAGAWFEVASFSQDENCAVRAYNYAPSGPKRFDVFRSCAMPFFELPTIGRAKIVGPGRLRQSLKGGPSGEIWVLWVDADYRTAVIAARDGREAWILDRSSMISEDRMNAAEEVLRFNGYDTDKLIRLTGEAA